MRKKGLAILCSTALLIAMFAGCSGSGADSAQSADSAAPAASESSTVLTESGTADLEEGKTTIVFYHWTPVREMEVMVKTFNESHDDIQVDYKPVPDSPDAMIKLNTMLMANEPMDVTSQWSTDHLQLRVQSDLYEPLDEYFEKNGLNYEEVFGSVVGSITNIDGKYWSMPYAYKAYGVIYNKSIFDAAGVPYPEEGWTWDEFAETALAVSSGEGASRVYGTCLIPHEMWYVRAAISLGLDAMYKPDGTASNFDDPMFLKGLQWLYDMQQAGSQKPLNEFAELQLDAQANRVASFYKGNFAMDIGPTFYISNWGMLDENSHDFECGVVPLPVENKGDPLKSQYEFSDLSMVKTSQNKDAAFEFMKFYCIDRPDVAAAEKCMQPPAPFPSQEIEDICVEKIYSATGFSTEEMLHTFTNTDVQLIPNLMFTTKSTAKTEIVDMMKQECNQVLFNEQTPQQAVENMKTKADDLIAKES